MVVRSSPVDLATSRATVLTSTSRVDWTNDSLHTWTEFFASTPEAWGAFEVHVGIAAGANGRVGVVKVGLGASGSEVELVKVPWKTGAHSGATVIHVPIAIPAGSRVSIAISANANTANDRQIQLVGYPAAEFGAGLFTNLDIGPFLGVTSGTYGRGVVVTAGATSHTKGAWTELSQASIYANSISGDSLPHDYTYLGFIVSSLSNEILFDGFIFDIAVGPPGSEVIVVENYALRHTSSNNGTPQAPSIIWFPASTIPVGSRISVRFQAGTASLNLAVYLAGLR